MEKAWKEACAGGPAPSSVLIPPGTYMAFPPILFGGPCKGPVEIKATGATIKAPPELARFKSDSWIAVQYINKLTMTGGTFDGQGQETWKSKKCSDTAQTCQVPVNIRFSYVKNSLLKDITSLNSKYFHINILGCDNTIVDHLTIFAPDKSINTDGMHIGRTNGLNITNSKIQTGDDCISFGDGSKNIHVERLTCGPGHGVSIGSLGKYANEQPVDGIWIKNCTMERTTNGVRIKTWPNSPPGVATNIHFEDIIMNNVENPILIDQQYCPHNTCKKGAPSRVKISNVSFKKIRGTSATKVALRIVCNQGLPCDNIEVSGINLTYKGGGGAISECSHVKPRVVGQNIPPACPGAPHHRAV
ncbi:Glycoside hydrolase, family 28, partial [Cynara cardunculus var. scolymus]